MQDRYASDVGDGHVASRALQSLDPELYDRLSSIVADGRRSTMALAEADVLPSGTVYFNDALDFEGLPNGARAAWIARRAAWLERALAATAGCGLIFADPDNGIRRIIEWGATGIARSSTRTSTNSLASPPELNRLSCTTTRFVRSLDPTQVPNGLGVRAGRSCWRDRARSRRRSDEMYRGKVAQSPIPARIGD